MKMLIAPSPVSRQTPHSANIYHSVSVNNGRWFGGTNGGSFIVGNKSPNGNGIKVMSDEDLKPVVNGFNGHRSMPSSGTNSLSISPSSDIKDASLASSPDGFADDRAVSPSSPLVTSERSIATEAAITKQHSLESRAHACLKRLKTLRSSGAKKALTNDLRTLASKRSQKVELNLDSDIVQTVCGDTLATVQKEEQAVSILNLPAEERQSTSDALGQLLLDVKRVLPDLEDEDATDLEGEDDDAYFKYKEALSLTENKTSIPVALPPSAESTLEKTPAWRYEQERLSLASRDAYLRLQIADLDSKIRRLSELSASKPQNTSSSQSDTSAITHACSSARTRPYLSSVSRKRTFYRISADTTGKSSARNPLSPSALVVRLSSISSSSSPVVTVNVTGGNVPSGRVCHCSCRSLTSLSSSPSNPSSPSSVSCILCQSQRRQNVVASQPDLDPETRLGLIDPAFHPKLSKLAGCDVLTSTTAFDRLDTAAACLLDHAYSADPLLAKPKPAPGRKSASPCGENQTAASSPPSKATPSKKSLQQQHQQASPSPTVSFSLPPIPLPAHLQKSNKLPNAFFVDPATLETASRLRTRKPSSASSSASVAASNRSLDETSLTKSKGEGSKKRKILLQQKRRLEQRKRLQIQRRKEQQRRQHQDPTKHRPKNLTLSAASSRRSSVHTPANARSSAGSLSCSMSNNGCLPAMCAGLSSSAPCGSMPLTPAPVSVGSGGFDIDNVVIPPPTPTALLAAAQALAESAAVEIATPGFRRISIEPLRIAPRAKQHRLSAPAPGSATKEPASHTGTGSLSEQTKTNLSPSEERLPQLSSSSSSSADVFVTPATPTLQAPAAPLVFEDIDEVVYRRRHAPFEQQERARYLAIMQHTIAPRKIRDLAVNARPPSQSGKPGKGLSRSCNEERLRRSSRVSAASSCSMALSDPECKPFVFPLSQAEWQIICAEKEAFAQLKQE